MKNFLEKLIRVGLDYNHPTYIKRRVVPANILALILFFCAATPFTIVSIMFLPTWVAFVPGIGGSFMGVGMLMNYFGKMHMARFTIALAPMISASTYNFVLTHPGEEPIPSVLMLQMVFMFLSFVVYDAREKYWILSICSICALLILGHPFFTHFVSIDTDVSIFRSGWVGYTTSTMSIISGFGIIFGIIFINIQAEKRLNRFFTLNADLFAIGNLKGTFYKINPAWKSLLDYETNDLKRKEFAEFLHPEDKNRFDDMLDNLNSGEKTSKITFRFKKKNGEYLHIQWNLFPDLDDGLFYASGRDITNQLKTEEKLRINDRALNSASTGVVITDYSKENNPIVYCNPASLLITGYELDDIIGQNNSILQRDDRDQEGINQLRMAIKNKKECKVVIRNYKKDNTMFWNEISISPVYNSKNEVTHYVGFQNDITTQVTNEEELKKSQEKLREMNAELNDFAHIVSHDLKAPLRAIMSLSDWIVQDYSDAIDDEGKMQFNLLTGRVKKMERLIDGILQYSRANKGDEEKELVTMNEVVDEVVEMLSPPDNIRVNIQAMMPELFVSRTRIQQVFQNIISNAIKYNDKQDGMISIECNEVDRNWVFSIADNGPGIDEKYFEKVFQIFQTLEVEASYESTGIGLTIVKKTIELHGGEIWLESELGKGTTFFFSLPQQSILENVKVN